MESDALSRRGGIHRIEMALGKGAAADKRHRISLGDDPLSHGVQNEFGGVVQAEFLQDSVAMGFDGVNAYIQQRRHLFVRFAFRKELDDFPLSRCEQLVSIDGITLF